MMRKYCSIATFCVAFLGAVAQAQLHIVPDHVGDPHFTSGPCPLIAPRDGAQCPNSAAECPAFYDPGLLPAGYNAVSYCATVPTGIGFGAPGVGMLTMALDEEEQRAFLRAAKTVESYVKDNRTVVVEPYKVSFIVSGLNYVFFYANEYWNPVCAADAFLPPFSDRQPKIVQNPDSSYSYQDFPETYTLVLNALKNKNATNSAPMELIKYLPSHEEINVEWPPTFFGWQWNTDLFSDQVSNFLVGTSNDYPIPPDAKPFTLCGSPAAMKMLGFEPLFARNGHTINDINSPKYNMNVTLEGTDGAVVIPDMTNAANIPPLTWMYDDTDPDVVANQLPKAFYEKSANFALTKLSCADPSVCLFPRGVNPGLDLTGLFNHELNHILGTMQSQYYKVRYENTSLAYTYGTALFLLDLFDLDSDYIVPGYGHPGLRSNSDFTAAPRNNNTSEPTTVFQAITAAQLTPWVQFGSHDHVMVYDVDEEKPHFFPFENYSIGNPDGDIQLQWGLVTPTATQTSMVFVDPDLVNMSPMNVVHFNVQGGERDGVVTVNTIREYSELAAQGWNVDYSTLRNPYRTRSRLAKWYRTCFDVNGVFTTAKDPRCKFSVLPEDTAFLSP